MGIHHTYKSNRGERSLQKQQKQDDLRRRSVTRKQQKTKEIDKDLYIVPEDEVVTLDILTKPKSD